MELVKYEVAILIILPLADMYSYFPEHFDTSGKCADSVHVCKRCFCVRFQTCSILTHIRQPSIQVDGGTRLFFQGFSP
jgi:hypothetical protein